MRKAGIDKILTKKQNQQRLEQLSEELEHQNKEESLKLLNDFRESFEMFLSKHRKLIETDPTFRLEFLELLNMMSVDPLLTDKGPIYRLPAAINTAIELLRPSQDKLAELCTLIVEISTSTRSENGGICELSYLHSLMPRSYKVTESDVLRALNELKHLGFQVIEIKGKNYFVSEIQLTEAQEKCLSLSSELRRGISCKDLSDNCNFTMEQAQIVLWELNRLGIVWIELTRSSEGKFKT